MSDSTPFLLSDAGVEPIHRLLTWLGLPDRAALNRRWARLARGPEAEAALAGLLPHLTRAVADCASPERAIANFERFVEGSADLAALFRVLTADLRGL